MKELFSSKILLFGEYSIIKGSKGLAVPFSRYNGSLQIKRSVDDINEQLKLDDLYDFFKGSGILSKVLDIKSFKKDLDSGLFFDSNIPYGHGVGSSGALCASLYHKYAFDFERKTQYKSEELKYLQDLMALMESFYHGSSSGFDCLVSLVNRPILIEERNNVNIVDMPMLSSFGQFYLYETGIIRKTSPLVHQFLTDFDEDEAFRNSFHLFQKNSDDIISSLIADDKNEFKRLFCSISQNQFVNFSKMIPDNIKKFWEDGLETNEYFVKFCGAGGGGFFLVYAPEAQLDNSNLIEMLS